MVFVSLPLFFLSILLLQVQRADHADDVRDPDRGELRGHVPHVPRPLVSPLLRVGHGAAQGHRRRDRAVPPRREEEEKGLFDCLGK